jgi:hypothetical protein
MANKAASYVFFISNIFAALQFLIVKLSKYWFAAFLAGGPKTFRPGVSAPGLFL